MPPPPVEAELPLTALFVSVSGPFQLTMPPTVEDERVAATVLFVSVSVPLLLSMPPPVLAALPLTVAVHKCERAVAGDAAAAAAVS